MNLTTTNNLTMSSYNLWKQINAFRIEEGGNKVRHDDFLARVKDECDDLGVCESFAVEKSNVILTRYMLNKDQMLLVGMRESKIVRKKVLMWIKKIAEPNVPTNFAEALQLAADQAKALELAAPKVAFVDNFVETGTTKTLRETAKILNYPERKMIALMIDHDILYRMSGKLLPYQKYHEQKLFEVKTGERNGHAFTQTRVTTKGLTWLGERYASDLMEDI